jgi:glutathione S-transferase
MTITLFHFQGSPNCLVAHLAVRRKALDVREVELPIGLHAGILRVLGFPRGYVPAARIDGRRVQGTTAIMRALDGIEPQPPLFPDAASAEAERWGEQVLQAIPRRILTKLVRRAPGCAQSWMPRGPFGKLPNPVFAATSGPVLRVQRWRLSSGGQAELEAALRELGPALDHVQGLLGRGVLNAQAPTAADLQIAAQVRCLLNIADLVAAVEARPGVAEHARTVAPEYPGRVPPVLVPAEKALVT